jgi:solute carrier family 25 (mitochondrial phosphate transporter), member 3
MPSLFPSMSALSATFGGASPMRQSQPEPAKRQNYAARSDLYSAWSVAEDAQKKTEQAAAVVAKEYTKASEIAQSKAGKIELYSGKYYAAYVPQQCILGTISADHIPAAHSVV